MSEQDEIISDIRKYLDQRADAEYFTDRSSPVPNEEMQLLTRLIEWQGRQSEGGEAAARAGITLDALSLREAAYWANPDRTPDEDDTEVRIEWMPERTSTDGEHMPAGHYLYYVDYPEEGVIGPIGEDPVPIEATISPKPESAGVPEDMRVISAQWLKQLHRDLDACQKLIWMALRGECDPSYCEDAQARLKEIDQVLNTTPQPDNWIRCSERLPTKENEDVCGLIWGWIDNIGIGGKWIRMSASEIKDMSENQAGPICKYWEPTGLTRPQPPAHGGQE